MFKLNSSILNILLEEFITTYQWQMIIGISGIFSILTIWFYLKQDKYEPEPKSNIILAFFAGILSSIVALIVSLLFIVILLIVGFTFATHPFFTSVVVAAVVEEVSKGVFVLLFSKSSTFDGPLDGLVYGAVIGCGFAFAENILYGFVFSDTSPLLGVGVTALRGLTQILGHPLYTGLFGLGVGAAKVGITKNPFSNLWKSIGLHSLWNFSAYVFAWAILGVIVLAIIILRRNLIYAKKLDKIAFETGYYERKKQMDTMGYPSIPPTVSTNSGIDPMNQNLSSSADFNQRRMYYENQWNQWLMEQKPWDVIIQQ
jgi:RsiW-degrading membrane proteinase PrsW (M82 family)